MTKHHSALHYILVMWLKEPLELTAGFVFLTFEQGKYEEGIAHLERVAAMREPEDPKTKAHYYEALILFSRYN